MKKNLAFLLALLMLASAAVGCSEAGTSGETAAENTAPDASAETVAEETAPEEETLVQDDLPADLKYNGTNVHIHGWSGPVQTEFYVEELNGDIVNDAIFERNDIVQERLDITLEYTLTPGAFSDRNTWVQTLANSITAGDGAFDISAGYSMAGASLAAQGMVLDLNTLDHIDFTKPWWPSSLTEEATVQNKLYFCSGDISTYMIYYMYGTYFNKQFLVDYSLENPYDLVTEGTWTIDKMMSMAEGVYVDADGNGVKNDADIFGFETHTTYLDPFYFGADLRTTDIGEGGLPVLSADFISERAHDMVVKLVGFSETNDAIFLNDYTIAANMFSQNRALFISHELTLATSYLRDAEIEYGIVPMPKYNEEQQDYYTVMSFPYSLYSIPLDVKDADLSAAVLECLASESYRRVTPALFETGFKVKYATDNESAAMFDIIRASVVFDFGRVFNDSFGGTTYSLFRNAVSGGSTDWVSTATRQQKPLGKQIEKLVKKLVGED